MSVEDAVSPKDEARMSGETADVAQLAVDSGFLRIFDEMPEFTDESLVAAVLEDAEWITIAVWEQRREGHCCQPGCFEVIEWDLDIGESVAWLMLSFLALMILQK